MKKLSLLLVACLAFLAATTQQKNTYRFSVNLDNVQRDRLLVELTTPTIKKNEITYRLPKIIPGYYNESNFGRFVEDLTAKDKAGNPLPVTRTGPNAWKISGAAQLATISYWVNDTYDDTTGNPIFEPCGSSIQADTAFVLNTHCLLGYFDGMTQLPYRLTVKHPQHLYGATALTDADPGNTTDLFTTENYNRMADNPVLYARPDTATIQTGQSTILFAVYSPNKKVSARYIADNCRALMQAQAAYLGGTLPVKKYAFLIYLSEQPGLTGATGALEHSYSSTYFTTEDEPETVMQFIRDNAAHEFFHILTPLNIHSEEIHYFDFDHPKMSKHLWLYEGSTEYHSMLVQARYKLVSQEEFLQGVSQRITASRRFFNDTLSFTEMSAGVLHEHAGQFGNVYQKGALIALCLDIQLLALSKGKYGLMHLVNDLSKKYGKNKPFKDADLFSEIGKLTYPQTEAFLRNYVGGKKPLPLKEMLLAAGINLAPEKETSDSTYTLGGISYLFNGNTGRWVVNRAAGVNAFGKKLGLQGGDEVVSVNGTTITGQNFGKTATEIYKAAQPGQQLTMVVNRPNPTTGNSEEKTLSTELVKIPVVKYNQLSVEPSPSPQQLMVRKAWLGE